jgi:hypothetical protein
LSIVALAAGLVLALVLWVLRPSLFFRLLSLGGAVMTALSVLAMLRTARKAKAIAPRALVVSMAISLLSVVVYPAVLGLHLGAGVWFGALICGALIGTGWALTVRLRLEGGTVKRDGGWLYLAVWGFFLTLSQLLVSATGRAPALAMLPLLLGTGIVVGQSTTLLWSCRRLRRGARGIAGLLLGLSLLFSGPARAGAETERAGPDRIPGDRVVATLKDTARTLGWNDGVITETADVWLLQSPDVKLGTLAVPVKGCPPPQCTPYGVDVYLHRSVSVFKVAFRPDMRGQCDGNQRLVDIDGLPACVWNKGSADQVFWGLQRDGRTVIGFNAYSSHCFAGMDLIKAGLCDPSQDNVLAVAEAVHQAALRNGLYAALTPSGGTRQASTPAPTAPPPVAVAEEAPPTAVPEEQTPTPAPEPPAIARPARRPTRVAPAGEAAEAVPVPPEEPQDSETEAPTPAETAAATVASGLLLGVGAWLFGKANGVGLGEVAGEAAAPFAEPAHHDGEVKADTGEVWSAEDGGWVSENLHQQERQRHGWLSRKAETDRAEMRGPDDLGNVAREISVGDRRIEERRRSIERRDAEIRSLEEEVQLDAERIGADAVAVGLQDGFREGQRRLLDQGYRVVNPGYDQALPVERVVDAVAWAVYNAPDSPGNNVSGLPPPGRVSYKPIRCEQAGDLGIADTKARLRAVIGDAADAAIVDLALVDVVRDSSVPGQLLSAFDTWLMPRNHVATRVILPDGRRYVLDYWEGMRGGERQMVPEAEWRARWKGRLGADMRFKGSGDYGQEAAECRVHAEVREATTAGGTADQGLEAFRQKEAESVRKGPGTEAEKAARLKQIDTMVRSYRRAGRFNDLD